MNKAAFVNFLRHLLFLLVVLKFISGVIMMIQSDTCRHYYDNQHLVPLYWEYEILETMEISFDMIFTVYMGIGFLVIVISIVGFVGAIELKQHKLINFSAGMAIFFMSVVELTSAVVVGEIITTLHYTIEETTIELFNSVNFIPNSSHANLEEFVSGDGNHFIYRNGWSTIAHSSPTNKSFIDFYHIIKQCCGPTGRFFWAVPPPSTCCSEEYQDANCTMAVAHATGCLRTYRLLRSCLGTMQIAVIFFAFVSLTNGIISLYLARIRVKYPNEEYGSESDSSSDVLDNISFP
ncbi:hypothetical protein Zmor_025579 [Zophobas morio]|uniref:Tetraspanin n=1 Tax=Zophobas morio TaxID=2755281 RepID=A0AA38HSD5_9CUCU|nr:hypothetical protein Zmor_025579 [Zophobas morio]